MNWLRLISACLVVTLGSAVGPAHPGSFDMQDDFQTLLLSFQEIYGFPGATAAYALPDGTVVSVAVGRADVEADIPMTPDSRMLAASIGKTIWGALALSLEADGVLDRSDLVADYLGPLPWFGQVPNAARMTIADLLTHSAGLPDHVQMEGFAEAVIRLGTSETFEPSQAIAFVLDEPSMFEPGSAWSYSDTGYLLLGLVIERAAGQNAYVLAEGRFLTPLDLAMTTPSDHRIIEGLAVGYTVQDNPFGLPPRTMTMAGALFWNPMIEWTGGGFASTSGDLARWGHALFSGDAMQAPYLDRLLDGVPVHPDAPGILYGTGVAIYSETPHGPVYGHGGWVPGYVSSLRHYADHNLTIAFQINTDVGVVDDSSDLVPALEAALAELLIDSTLTDRRQRHSPQH